MSVLFAFPGQGAQTPGLLHRLPQHEEVDRTLAEASAVLKQDILALDSASALRSTIAVQLCLLLAGVAAARTLAAQGNQPDIVVGLSIGAFPAAVVAGALDFADAVRLVELRGRLMENAYPSGYGMAALIGLDHYQLAPLIDMAQAQGHAVHLANLNAEKQLVIAGSEAGMQRVIELAHNIGPCKAKRLAVSVPSHCTLMNDAAEQMATALARVRLEQPRLTYLSASAARVIRDPVSLSEDLAHNMARVVRWREAAQLAYERGARLMVEMPPGNVLTGLVKPLFGPGQAAALSDTRPDTVAALIARERDGSNSGTDDSSNGINP